MPISLDPATFVNGQALDPDKLNKALYDTALDGAGDEQGVYSYANGGVDADSFAVDFKLRQELLQPRQMLVAKAGGGWTTLDNMSDVSGRTAKDIRSRLHQQQALPGCGLRVYVPFTATAIRWNVSFFWYATRWWGLDPTVEPPTDQAQDIELRLFIDGAEDTAYRRQLPLTWFARRAGTSSDEIPYSLEAEQAAHWNLSYTQTVVDQSDPDAKLAQGFHEIYLGFYVRPIDGSFTNTGAQKFDRQGTTSVDLDLYQRFSAGCRSARAVGYR